MNARGRRIYRLGIILVILLAAAALTAAALIKKPSDVGLTLRVSQLSFTVNDSRASRLFNSVNAKFITISRYARLLIEEGNLKFMEEGVAPNGWRAAGDAKSIVPNIPFSNVTLESVTLNQMNIPPGTNMVMSWSEDEPDALNLSLDKPVSGEMAGGTPLLFSCTACSVEGVPATLNLPSLKFQLTNGPQQSQIVRFQGEQNLTIVALVLTPKTKLKMQDIDVRQAVNFTNLEDGRPVSTIIDGKVHFDDMSEDGDIKIGEATLLDLGDLDNAVIKTLEVDNGINVTLSGRANRLSVGTEGHLEDKLPSYLEWLYARHALKLIGGGLIFVISAVVSIHRWWRKGPE